MRHFFGYSFQSAVLFDSMTGAEMLEWIKLPGMESMRLNEIPGGIRKRIRTARALFMQTDNLFDEPTTGLDSVLSEAIKIRARGFGVAHNVVMTACIFLRFFVLSCETAILVVVRREIARLV